MTKLHVFDMDGTLLRGAAVEELSRALGCFAEASELEQAYRRGEFVDEPLFWDQVLALWSSATEDDIDQAFAAASWMDGVREVFADISARGEHSVVISQSPLFVVQRLEGWGAHATYATTVQRGVPCRTEHLLTEHDKVTITTRLLEDLDLAATDCVAYGDSTSDVPLFRHLPFTVGVNATGAIRELATETYEGSDLRAAYDIGRELLACTEVAANTETRPVRPQPGAGESHASKEERMSSYGDAKRAAGAAIRASAPKQEEIRFPRLFHFEEIESMPRLAFSKGGESGVFISREREGARYYSQGICFHAPDMGDIVWQGTSWDEAFYCISGKLRVIVNDADGNELDYTLEPGDHFWAPAGYKYTLRATGVESLNYWTTSPQMPSGWRYTGDDESYSDLLIGMRRVAQPQH